MTMEMPNRDKLTGLWDRGTFDSEISEQVDEADRTGDPLALVVVDIDHFKSVNDTHGHQKGDAILAGVARRLETVAKGKGKVYRYGGEEMVIVLSNHSSQEAVAIAERARLKLECEQIEGISITASFGVSAFPEHGSSAADAFATADKALYDAKDRGRNLVRIFGEPEPAKAGPRRVDRKAPEPGKLKEHQKADLKRQHFRGYRIVCPDDQAILDVREVDLIGVPIRGLSIYCPMCGLCEEL